MPLKTCEVAQCECCEEYCRLGELVNAEIDGENVKSLEITEEEDHRYDDGLLSDYLGDCPECGSCIFVRHVA